MHPCRYIHMYIYEVCIWYVLMYSTSGSQLITRVVYVIQRWRGMKRAIERQHYIVIICKNWRESRGIMQYVACYVPIMGAAPMKTWHCPDTRDAVESTTPRSLADGLLVALQADILRHGRGPPEIPENGTPPGGVVVMFSSRLPDARKA